MTIKNIPTIFCAVDTPNLQLARQIAEAISVENCGIKLGLEFFNANGPQGVKYISEHYPDIAIFLDMKYHDIPNTVASSLRAIAPLEVAFVNVHCAGGKEMMKLAVRALKEECSKIGVIPPKILGVTILTSMNQQAIEEVGYNDKLANQVKKMAVLAKESGLDGVVCSAHEIRIIKDACGDDFITMVPGIRPASSNSNDQKRTMTPEEAIKEGAHHLVIGRPITKADNPVQAVRNINQSIKNAS